MSMIPLLAMIATMAAALSISTDSIRIAISQSIPKEIAELLNGIVQRGGINFNIVIFYFSAFLLASNGTFSMINTSNEIYKVKPRNILSRRIKAIVMIFILMCLFLFLIVVPVFGTTISDIIIQATGDTKAVLLVGKILSILKYPLIIIVLFINIKLMYIIAPDEVIPSKTTNKGAVFTTVLWVLSTEIFAFYIGKFASYDIFYGSLSNLAILMLIMYFLAFIFVIGIGLNVKTYEYKIKD